MNRAIPEVTKAIHSLTDSELEVISGGGGMSETVSGSGGGIVSGPAAGGSDKHTSCPNTKLS